MKVKATQKGWYNKRLIKEGTVFEYTGKEPPLWAERIGAADYKTDDKPINMSEQKSEDNGNGNQENKDNQTENKNGGETLLEKNKQIQNAQNKGAEANK